MSTIPEAAIEAAIEAVMRKRHLVSEGSRRWARPIVTDALEAALPHLVAVPSGSNPQGSE